MIFFLLSILGGAALQSRPADARKGENWFDFWSLLHVASGALLAALGLSWKWALLILVGFELWEMALRKGKTGDALLEYESIPNVIGDVLFGLLGFFLLKTH
jgi:hypothetical protein